MNPISILIVDDVSETLEVMSQCLGDLGHDVTCASGGREAIELLEGRRFDLVITDVLMPDADGMQVIMGVRKTQPTTLVIAMSGGGDFLGGRDLLNLADALGADAGLMKPFSRLELLEAIERVCTTPVVLEGAA
jgi:CheY-like chemotaxis protein